MSTIKGVVLEKNRRFAIILTADGQFKKIVTGNFEIGEEVLGKEFKPRNGIYQRLVGGVAVAAALLLAVLIPGLLEKDKISPNTIVATNNAENTVVAFVKVDINPSLELGVDENLAIKEVKPLNADGEQLLAQGDLLGMNVSEAMGIITEWCYKLGYMAETKDNVVNVTYISKDTDSTKIDTNKLEQEIRANVAKVMEKKKIKGEVKEIKEVLVEKKDQEPKQAKEVKQNESDKENQGKVNEGNIENDLGDEGKNAPAKNNKPKTNTIDEIKTKGFNLNNEKDKDKEEKSQKLEKKNESYVDELKDNNKDKSKDNNGVNTSEQSESKFKEKSKGNLSEDLGLRSPWYKIFELG